MLVITTVVLLLCVHKMAPCSKQEKYKNMIVFRISGPDPELKSDRCIYCKTVGAKFDGGGACTPGKFCFDEFSELHSPAF